MNEVKLFKAKKTDRIPGCEPGHEVHFEGKRIGQVAHKLGSGNWMWRPESAEGVPTAEGRVATARGKAVTALLANVAEKSGPKEAVEVTVKVDKSRVGGRCVVKNTAMRFCNFGRIRDGKSEPCGAPTTHAVKDYYFVAAKGHRDAYACKECADRLAGFPNFMRIVSLRKTVQS